MADQSAPPVRLVPFPLPLPEAWIEPLSALRSDARTLRMILSSSPPPQVPLGRADLEEWVRRRQQDTGAVFQAAVTDGLPIGFVLAVSATQDPSGRLEVGLALEVAARGRGLGHAVLGLLIAALPPEPGLIARVRVDNGPALALFHAAGFRPIGREVTTTPQDPGPVDVDVLACW